MIFLVIAFLHTCPSETSVHLAVRPTASTLIFWTSWTSWIGLDAASGVIAGEDLGSFSCLLGIQDVDATFSQPVWEVPDVIQNLFDMSLFGSDLGDALNCNTVQSCVADSDVNVAQQLDCRADVRFSRADVNKALFEARLQHLGDTELKYPWESGVMNAIFAELDEIAGALTLPVEYWGLTDQLHEALVSVAASFSSHNVLGRDLELPFFLFAMHVKPDKDLFAEQEVLWTRALDMWAQLFEVLGSLCHLGEALDTGPYFADPFEQGTVLRDAVGVKSHRTTLNRAQTLLQFFRWLQCDYIHWKPWDRSRCLAYSSSSDNRVPAASLGMLFMVALRISKHVLQISITGTLLQDPQLKGSAQRLMLTKDGYHPAGPLKIREIAALEKLMMSRLDTLDRYMICAVLFTLFSRSRWYDLRFIHCVKGQDTVECDSDSNSLASTSSGLSDADDDTFPAMADAAGFIDGPVVEES